MNRKQFLGTLIAGVAGMSTIKLKSFGNMANDLPNRDFTMPVLFMGHGSPMNGIEDNEFTKGWERIAKEIPTPAAVLCISAHWLTRGTHVTAMNNPKTIHDFGGFPQELFAVQYPAPGDPTLAAETTNLIQSTQVGLDHEWGLDHGCWTVVRKMYPDANIPVIQLSIDYNKPPQYHYEIAKELAALRKKGVLIMGSGNMVHNLRMVDWAHMNTPDYGFDWAKTINEKFKTHINSKTHKDLINYMNLGPEAKLAIPTPDHYYPMLYSLGLQSDKDEVDIFNDKYVAGSLTMTSLRIG
ncbi:4,5-DOPA dioxygenase extradiol [Marinoscillum pacificum]|uniref:4,5-DOPA-extradiol-dioxygenase n=1 Tax=Marinoscillum pacificum TaxID=392723 RepID=UPI0021585BF5|nr:4,5-DOPA dioxygenase extradiol [Marinoscillum pacificum]